MPVPIGSERTLRAILRYTVDPRGIRDVRESTDELEEALSDLRSHFFDAMEPVQDIGMLSSQFEALGFEVQDYGRRITETFQTFAEDYVSEAEKADDVSREWLQTTENLQASQQKFGKVSASSMLPMLKLQAQIIEMAASFAEDYPEIAQIAFGIGTAMVLASSLANAVSKGIRLVADIKLLAMESQRVMAAKMMRDAANTQMAAAGVMATAGKQTAAGGGVAAGGGMIKAGLSGAASFVGGMSGILSVGAIVASLAAIGIATKKFVDDVDKGQKKVDKGWSSFISRTAKQTEDSTEVVERYRDAQQRVSDTLDKAGIVADVFVDRTRAVSGGVGELSNALVSVSDDYDEYIDAVNAYNDSLREGERELYVVTRDTFEYRRELEKLRRGLERGIVSLKEYSSFLIENGNVMNQIVGTGLMALAQMQEETALKEVLDDWIEFNEEMKRSREELTSEIESATEEFNREMIALEEELSSERIRALGEFNASWNKLEADSAAERERLLLELANELVSIEDRAAAEREQAMIDFNREIVEAEEEYYKERAEAAASYGQEIQRAEEDHQREMRRMREDSEGRRLQAIRSRDALALLEEVRSYEKDRSRAEEDHRTEMSRRSEDFAQQMAQMEQSFVEQQAARQQAYSEQLADIEQRLKEEQAAVEESNREQQQALEESRVNELRALYDHKEEELKALEDSNEQQEIELEKSLNTRISDARAAYRTQVADNRKNLNQRLQDAGMWNSRELAEYNRFRDQALGTLRSFVNQANIELQGLVVKDSDIGYASGGYAGFTTRASLGEQGDEFVLNNRTTRAAEKLAGRRLTQDSVLASMAGDGAPSVSQSFVFHGRLSADEKREYERIAYEQSLLAVRTVVRGVRT